MKLIRLIDETEQKRFVESLRDRVAAAGANDAELPRRLARELGWPNLSRLDAYSKGKHFPSPATLRTIARELKADYLHMLAEAGYLREVIDALYAIAQYDDERDRRIPIKAESPEHQALFLELRKSPRDICIDYVRYRFRVRDEVAAMSAYGEALQHFQIGMLVDPALKQLDRRHRPHPLVRMAMDALAMTEIPAEARSYIVSECMRAWANVLAKFPESSRVSTIPKESCNG